MTEAGCALEGRLQSRRCGLPPPTQDAFGSVTASFCGGEGRAPPMLAVVNAHGTEEGGRSCKRAMGADVELIQLPV